VDDHRDVGEMDSIFVGEFLLGHTAGAVSISNGYDLSLGQLGTCVGFAYLARPEPAALGDGIPDVVGLGSEEKMCRIDASSVVAGMENEHPGRRIAVGESVGNAMGVNVSAMDREPSMAPDALVSEERPTGVGSTRPVDFGPEPFFERGFI
jgi:hypothetical protein